MQDAISAAWRTSSSNVQSNSATIDHMSLATATSRPNENSAGNLDKEVQPKWDVKVEPWTAFQHKVEIWAASHDIAHLLECDPYPSEQKKHDTAMRNVLLNLPSHDRAYVVQTCGPCSTTSTCRR